VITADIESWLIAKQSNAQWQAQLLVYINRWIALGTTTTTITGGSVCEIQGVTNDPNAERSLLRDKVQKMVPFYKKYQYLAKLAGGGGTTIEFIR
jgi:hypothetical protein